MLKEDIEHIVNLIVKKTSMKRDEVLNLVKRKVEEFEGLIDEHAAVLMVAKEVGVHVSKERKILVTPLKIKDLVHGLRNVIICARVLSVMPVRKYIVDGKELSVVKVLLADETGTIPLTLWNERIEIAKALKPNSLIVVTRAVVKKFKKSLELSLTDNSEVKLVKDEAIKLPPISKLAPKDYKGETITICVNKVLISPIFSKKMGRQRTVACLRGNDVENNRRVRIIAWNSLAESLSVSSGDIIKVINAKLLSTDNGLNEYLLTKWSIVENVGKTHIEEEEGTKSPSSITDRVRGIDVEGCFGYIKPRGVQSLRLMLHDFHRAMFLDLPSSSASRLLHKMFIQDFFMSSNLLKYRIKVDDVDVIEVNNLPLLKVNPWSSISITENKDKFKCIRKMFIKELTGNFLIRATVLRANLKIIVYNPFKKAIEHNLAQESELENCALIGFLRLLLEDGINQALAFTNSWKVISNLFDIDEDEILELARTPNVLKEIIEYTAEVLEGREYVFSGLAITSHKGNRVLILTNIEPINLSYEIKLLEEYIQKLEEVKKHGKKETREKETNISTEEEDT